VAGAGGTSWIQVEKYRSKNPLFRRAAEAFGDWGIPTAVCIEDVRKRVPTGFLIASGGLKNGVDAAKSIALGAHLAGFGRSLLKSAVAPEPTEIVQSLEQIELELKIAMFGAGISKVEDLGQTNRLVRKL
jgi:isopentenyl-diphosphate delta-isomerase